MKLLLSLFLSMAAFGLAAEATSDPFIASWIFQPQRSEVKGQTWHIFEAGPHRYKLAFADESSVVLPDNGAEQAHPLGGFISLKQIDDHSWQMIRKRPVSVIKSIITISADGRTMTNKGETVLPNGEKSAGVLAYRRSGTGEGLAGEWRVVSMALNGSESATLMRIERYGADGLSVVYPADQTRLDFRFDGKQYPEKGPNAAKGSTSSARRINRQTIVLDGKLNGKPWDTTEYKLSADGNTLVARYRELKDRDWQTYTYERH